MSFDTLGLSKPILKAIQEKGYSSPSPIQVKSIPAVLTGKDLMAAAQTGTGKTAGFVLPILEKLIDGPKVKSNHARVLVLTPTRELAAQIEDNIQAYGKHLRLTSTVVFGGVKINPQMMRLRKGTDILVATPGRLLDLYNQKAIRFEALEVLVLDEADRMLDMGFIHDIRKILNILPARRQNLMFSATFSDDIRKLAKTIVHDPIEVSVAAANSAVETVKHWIVPVDKAKKPALLIHLIKDNQWTQVLVFSRTKHGANRLATQLTKSGINAAAIHGNKSQGARTKALADFKSGKVHVLVATDIAARGIDISQLPHVINLDLPNVPEDYVHRIGRTGRAGEEGEAISLVCADEIKQLKDIERLINKLIPREYEPGYEPNHEVPQSKLGARQSRAKKQKRPNHNSRSRTAVNTDAKPVRQGGRRHNGAQQGSRRRTSSNQTLPPKPKSIIDEEGFVNGNRADVETHYSDNIPGQGPKRQQVNRRGGNARSANTGRPNSGGYRGKNRRSGAGNSGGRTAGQGRNRPN